MQTKHKAYIKGIWSPSCGFNGYAWVRIRLETNQGLKLIGWWKRFKRCDEKQKRLGNIHRISPQ